MAAGSPTKGDISGEPLPTGLWYGDPGPLLDRLLLSPTNRCRSLRCSLYVSAKLSRVPTSPVSTDEARQSPKNSHFDGPFTVCGIRRVQKWFCLLEVTENWKCNDLYTLDPQMNQFFIPQLTITTKWMLQLFKGKNCFHLILPMGESRINPLSLQTYDPGLQGRDYICTKIWLSSIPGKVRAFRFARTKKQGFGRILGGTKPCGHGKLFVAITKNLVEIHGLIETHAKTKKENKRAQVF
jgi:hypothetical protein